MLYAILFVEVLVNWKIANVKVSVKWFQFLSVHNLTNTSHGFYNVHHVPLLNLFWMEKIYVEVKNYKTKVSKQYSAILYWFNIPVSKAISYTSIFCNNENLWISGAKLFQWRKLNKKVIIFIISMGHSWQETLNYFGFERTSPP